MIPQELGLERSINEEQKIKRLTGFWELIKFKKWKLLLLLSAIVFLVIFWKVEWFK